MQQVNIHEAKTHLSKLIEMAVQGQSFVIAKSGKPMVMVSAYTPPPDPANRIGFLKGSLDVPADLILWATRRFRPSLSMLNETPS